MKREQPQRPNMEDIISMANSPSGKQLMDLICSDPDPHFQTAIRQAESGDYSNLQTIVQKLLASPETADLIQKMRGKP